MKNCYKPDHMRQLGSTVCSNPREVTVENNFLMNAITHFFQPPAYVFFILLDFWGHRFAAFQKTAKIDFELRGRHVGKPHYVLRVTKICVRKRPQSINYGTKKVCPRKFYYLNDKRPRKSRNKVVYVLNKIENKPGHCSQTIKIWNGHIGSF